MKRQTTIIWHLGLFPTAVDTQTAEGLLNQTRLEEYTTLMERWFPWRQDRGLLELSDLLGGRADMWGTMMMFLDPLVEMNYYTEEFSQEVFIAVLNEHDLLMTSIITRWVTAYAAETKDQKLAEKMWLLVLKMNEISRAHYDLVKARPVLPSSTVVSGEAEEEEKPDAEVTFVNLAASKLIH